MDSLKDILPLAQTGSAGVALILAFVIFKMYVKNNETTETMVKRYDAVIDRNTESHIKLAGAMASHTAAMQSLEKTIDRKI